MNKSLSQENAMNLKVKHISSIVIDVMIKVSDWSKRTTFMVVTLDDFHIVLRIEFLQWVWVVSMLFLNTLCIDRSWENILLYKWGVMH